MLKEKFHFYIVLFTILATAITMAPAHAESFQDNARVMNVTPHVVQVQRPVCHTTEVRVPRQQSQQDRGYIGGAMGGAGGALLGSQVGRGNGNKAAIGVAAIAGAIAGDRMQNGNDPNRGVMGAAVGGTAGALLGSQIGGGNGNNAAIALGAILGAAAGDNVQNGQAASQPQQPVMETRQQQVCEQQMTDEQHGYDVTYEFEGRQRTTWMSRDPGRYVTLDISTR